MTRLHWWVTALFILSMGVTAASSLVQPRAMELVCSGAGAAKLVVSNGYGGAALDVSGMDCSLCLLGSAPPEPPHIHLPAQTPMAGVPPIWVPSRVPAFMAAPPPARAPPIFPLALT